MAFRVVLDANVLVPARLRDVLLTLGEAELFAPLWSETILAETLKHLPQSMGDSARTALVEAMQNAFPDALVTWPSGVQVEGTELVNEKDRHLAAAAVFGHADTLVTEDRQLRLEAIGICNCMEVGTFLAYTIDVAPHAAADSLARMMRRWPESQELAQPQMWSRLVDWMTHRGWGAAADLIRDYTPDVDHASARPE